MLLCLLAMACTDCRPGKEWLVTEARTLLLWLELNEWAMAHADWLCLARNCLGEAFFF